MKTSEDKLNEALRAALKRKFDHFEEAPHPAAFDKIRANLKATPQWKYLFFTMLFVGIVIIGIVADQHFMQKSIAKMAVNNPAKIQTAAFENNIPPRVAIQNAFAEMNDLPSKVAPQEKKFSKLMSNPVNPHLIHDENIKRSRSLTPQSVGDEPDKKEKNVIQAKIEQSNTTNEDETSDANRVADMAINPLALQPADFNANVQILPKINVAANDIKPVTYKKLRHVDLVLNVAVLQSYQILTVPSGAQSFQNFDFPSTFSLKSLGYKFSIGAENHGFQFLLHYSRFKQDYSYEIAGNDYIVETIDKDNFKVIRQGTRVSQENQFSLLGIGANKQVKWGNASIGKYYASAGLEYSYGLIRKQSIGWINAGIGKQFPVSKNRSLQIGPYAEFSPVKFTGSGDPFFYQPYRVGIAAGLRLNR